MNNFIFRLKTEIDEIIRGKTFITKDDLDKLEYTTCVIKETLRLWPISVSYTRATTEDIVINGTLVPKDTCIIVILLYLNEYRVFFFIFPHF